MSIGVVATTVQERLACEDVVLFVNAAITSTGQREFRSGAADQHISVHFLHRYMLGNYRDLYAATLALDINDFNAALVACNLLQTPGGTPVVQRRLEGRLIARRLEQMPPQRVHALFRELGRLRVNNRRTRAIIRDWLAARPDPGFDAVKYRAAVKAASRHAHLRHAGELGTFLFAPHRQTRYDTPILETWRRAHYTTAALYKLPYTVAEGLAAKHGIDRVLFLERIAPRLTRHERLRLQASADRHAVGVEADLAALPLTRLASYVLGLPRDERKERRAELGAALRAVARRAVGRRAGTWGRVVAVLDDSFSSSGSTEKRRRPLAVALAANYLLEALAEAYTGLWLAHRGDPLLVHPIGPTPLGDRVLDALQRRPDRLVIVSDGWDNAPPGQAAEVLRVWRERLDPEGSTSVVHLNPVFDANDFDVRRLAPGIPTVGVRDAEDAPALVELARFSEGTAGLSELRAHLVERVDRFLATGAARPERAGAP
jgi:hypothetical protein